MVSVIISGIIAFLVIFAWTRYFGGNAGVVFEKDDPRLLAAKEQARRTLPTFWAAVEGGDPADEGFTLKFNLLHGSGSENNESIWAGDVVRRDGRIFGKLVNDPVSAGFQIGQEIEIAPEAIDDWGYWHKGVGQGHYVTRLMIEAAPGNLARHQRKEMGWA
jgi:uncharacterized protein YegJ (DUF2314 family)